MTTAAPGSSGDPDAIARLTRVNKWYGNDHALRDIDLAVAAGERIVICGPSGSGKSTLVRTINLLEPFQQGHLAVCGVEVDANEITRAARLAVNRHVGMVFQQFNLFPHMTVLQNLTVGPIFGAGVKRAEALEIAQHYLRRVGLTEHAHKHPAQLSGGQQQRVAICSALAHRPRLFIADEPTGELDSANAAQIYELVRALSRDAGATTVLVSHDPESAAVADRVVQIRDGRVSGEGGDAVVNRGGWVRIPEDLLHGASRARLEPAPEGVMLRVRERAAEPERAVDVQAPGEVVARTVSLAKSYGDERVFSDLSIELPAGQLSAVTGPSGSGKSTLLHLLAGLDLPSAGEVLVLGTSVQGLDPTRRALLRRDHIGLVTQGTDLVPFLTAKESVELALALRGVSRSDASSRAVATLASVGLDELSGQRVARLSMGERQRVAVARALAARPELLLADEPTARLDEANARAVGRLFAELAATTGTAIVCATHDPVLIEAARLEVPLATLAA